MASSKRFSSASLSGQANRISGRPAPRLPEAFDRRELGRLVCRSMLSPCMSPSKICSGATIASDADRHAEQHTRRLVVNRRFSRYHALTPATTKRGGQEGRQHHVREAGTGTTG